MMDDEGPIFETIRQTQHTARTGRKCGCGKTIPPGKIYVEDVFTQDGEFVCRVMCRGWCYDEADEESAGVYKREESDSCSSEEDWWKG